MITVRRQVVSKIMTNYQKVLPFIKLKHNHLNSHKMSEIQNIVEL